MDRLTCCPQNSTVLYHQPQIDQHLDKLARQIESAYHHADKIVVIVLLAGAKRFADDLFARIDDDKFEIQYVKAASYYNAAKSSGQVDVEDTVKAPIAGRDVLLIDDIYDSGRTLNKLVALLSERGAADIKTCVLLEKLVQHTVPIDLDFDTLEVPDRFVVGYGLDHDGMYRELPFIAALDVVTAS